MNYAEAIPRTAASYCDYHIPNSIIGKIENTTKEENSNAKTLTSNIRLKVNEHLELVKIKFSNFNNKPDALRVQTSATTAEQQIKDEDLVVVTTASSNETNLSTGKLEGYRCLCQIDIW